MLNIVKVNFIILLNKNLIKSKIKLKDSQGACKILINFLDCIGMRGFLTAIGVRVTPGSCENVLPKREELFKYFNIVYQVNFVLKLRKKLY